MKGLGRLIGRRLLCKRLEPWRKPLMPRRLIFSSFTTTSYLENPTSSSRFTSFKSSSLPKWSHFGGHELVMRARPSRRIRERESHTHRHTPVGHLFCSPTHNLSAHESMILCFVNECLSSPFALVALRCLNSFVMMLLCSGQRRTMFIQTQSTPNPASLMFYPGKPVMEVGSVDFPNSRSAMSSPLAKSLYGIDGITRVFFGSDFITVTKSDDASWDFIKPEIFAAIMDFYSSGKPLFLDSNTAAAMDTAIHEVSP
ncbi:NifU-like protein 4, mitochondrial [Vitis vinifera]|uniref:NifU-like protein 4, mitochondrial n=1 Tax=Vitis vinifera TaxID=29760 RepID=A0A438DND7_VITVI|nr:NifU-like protein 4, mitochondrial [Vitis vinifera]